MSALATCYHVLQWALAPEQGPPQGDLFQPLELLQPPPQLLGLQARLIAQTAARSRFNHLCNHPAGANDLLLAPALALPQNPRLALALLDSLEPARSPIQWLFRHGLIAPALPFLKPELQQECLAVSPLTALLWVPPAHQQTAIRRLAESLIQHPVGRLALLLHLAQPVEDNGVRNWRRELMERWRSGSASHRALVLDVYETAVIQYQDQLLEQVAWAGAVFADPEASDVQIARALSIARWWQPLHHLEKADPEALRQRFYLGYNYRLGLKLYRANNKTLGAVS